MLLEEISRLTGMSPERLSHFGRSAGRRYKTYQIPKRNGGFRVIEQPARPIKALQRIVIDRLLANLPVHPACLGYRKKLNIADVAEVHREFPFTLRVDFSNFFWSFRCEDIQAYLTDQAAELTEADISFVCNLVSRTNRLTMGAPSSPIITNIMLFDLDRQLADCSLELGCVFARYADDLYFSAAQPFVLGELLNRVRIIVGNWARPTLQINEEKTTFLSRKYRRRIVGLIITPNGEISIGRERKRRITSLAHKALIGELTPDQIASLDGEIAWTRSVEPSFVERLAKKYGQDHLSTLFSSVPAPMAETET